MHSDQFLHNARRNGALVSGEPVAPDFDAGWGHPPFSKGKMIAHHWRADRSHNLGEGVFGLRSACGVLTVSTPQVPLMGPGNLPFCARCEAKLTKSMQPNYGRETAKGN
jgi:hypothetical protein